MGRGTKLRLADALPPPGPRLRTTPRTPRSDGAVGHRRHHDPATGPHNGRHAASSPMGQPPRHSLSPRTTRSTSSVTIYQQALTPATTTDSPTSPPTSSTAPSPLPNCSKPPRHPHP